LLFFRALGSVGFSCLFFMGFPEAVPFQHLWFFSPVLSTLCGCFTGPGIFLRAVFLRDGFPLGSRGGHPPEAFCLSGYLCVGVLSTDFSYYFPLILRAPSPVQGSSTLGGPPPTNHTPILLARFVCQKIFRCPPPQRFSRRPPDCFGGFFFPPDVPVLLRVGGCVLVL